MGISCGPNLPRNDPIGPVSAIGRDRKAKEHLAMWLVDNQCYAGQRPVLVRDEGQW